jgi:hypothetical protein
MGGNNDAIALPDIFYGAADFCDDAEGLVTDDSAFETSHAAFVKMEVCAADGGGSDAKEDVGGLLYLRVCYFMHRNPTRFIENYRFHKLLLVIVIGALAARVIMRTGFVGSARRSRAR